MKIILKAELVIAALQPALLVQVLAHPTVFLVHLPA